MDSHESVDEPAHRATAAKDYLLAHGAVLKFARFETPSSANARTINASVSPTQFPRVAFEHAANLQTVVNELYIRATLDPDWLYSVLRLLIKSDVVASSLWNVYLATKRLETVQELVCGIFRADYMLHDDAASVGSGRVLKQVEVNHYSVAGACHAETVADMHGHLRKVAGACAEVSASPAFHMPQRLIHPPHRRARLTPGISQHAPTSPLSQHQLLMLMRSILLASVVRDLDAC